MFRPIRSSPARPLLRQRVVKYSSRKVNLKASKDRREDTPSGSRPTPWVYSTSVGLRLVLIPSACVSTELVAAHSRAQKKHVGKGGLLYAVFFADFGDREHVFMPVCSIIALLRNLSSLNRTFAATKPRRWLQRQRDAFFSITPEERRLVEKSSTSQIRERSLAGASSEG